MSATHKIPKIKLDGVDEDGFVCYPRRGDSLSFYSKRYDRRFGLGKGWLEIPPNEASAYMGERLGIPRTGRETGRHTSAIAPGASPSGSSRCRAGAKGPFVVASRSSSTGTNRRSSRTFFKNFLRIDVAKTELHIRCFAATGCREHEENPPMEDEVKIKL